jgi:hypothetical protein
VSGRSISGPYTQLHRDDVAEAQVLERQLQRGLQQAAAVVARDDDRLHPVAQVQQRFDLRVVLVVVRDEHVVDRLGQVREGV